MLVGPPAAAGEQAADPGGVKGLLLGAMTVGFVVDHLPVVSPLLVVYLPEDHAAVLRGAHPIADGSAGHLLIAEIAAVDHSLAELVLQRPTALPEVENDWPARRQADAVVFEGGG